MEQLNYGSNNFMNWKNPGWAVVTGSSSGIGREFAKQLAEQKFNLILIARRERRLLDIKNEYESDYGIKVEIIAADLSINQEIERISDHLKNFNDIDVLVNNAGFGVIGNFMKLGMKSHFDMMQVHMFAPVQLVYAVLGGMIERNRGVIINTASIGAFSPVAYNGLYHPTKSFLVGFAEILGMELLNTDVRIQSLCPGFTRTEFHSSQDLNLAKKKLPNFVWMEADKVVKKSLKAAYKGKIVYIPGFLNWIIAKLVPKWIQKKVFLKQVFKNK